MRRLRDSVPPLVAARFGFLPTPGSNATDVSEIVCTFNQQEHMAHMVFEFTAAAFALRPASGMANA